LVPFRAVCTWLGLGKEESLQVSNVGDRVRVTVSRGTRQVVVTEGDCNVTVASLGRRGLLVPPEALPTGLLVSPKVFEYLDYGVVVEREQQRVVIVDKERRGYIQMPSSRH
jgi:hypothetical protein